MITDVENEVKPLPSWKIKYLVAGAVVGGLIGLGSAYLYTQKYENRGEQAEMTLWSGVKIGILVLGLVRSLASMADE